MVRTNAEAPGRYAAAQAHRRDVLPFWQRDFSLGDRAAHGIPCGASECRIEQASPGCSLIRATKTDTILCGSAIQYAVSAA